MFYVIWLTNFSRQNIDLDINWILRLQSYDGNTQSFNFLTDKLGTNMDDMKRVNQVPDMYDMKRVKNMTKLYLFLDFSVLWCVTKLYHRGYAVQCGCLNSILGKCYPMHQLSTTDLKCKTSLCTYKSYSNFLYIL